MDNTPVIRKTENRLLFVISALLAGFAITYKTTEAAPFWAYGKVTQDFIIARIYSTLGDYQFDMMIAALLCGCAMKLIGERSGKQLKGYVLPMILGLIVVLGRSANALGNLSGIFETVPFIIRSVLAAAGFGIIFRYVFALAEAGLERVSLNRSEKKIFAGLFGKHIFRNVCLLLMILWLPAMILNYPGNHNADFIGQLMQTTGDMPWSGHHPIVLTAFIGIFFGAFKAVFGYYDPALFVWIFLQALGLSAALSLTITYLKKKGASQYLLVTVLAVYVLSPVYSNIATTAIKDVPFAAACIWYCVLTAEYYEDVKAFAGKRSSLIKIIIASVLICVCRNNGSIIVFVNGLVMSVYGLGKTQTEEKADIKMLIKKTALFLILPIGIYTAFSSGIKAYVNAESDGLKEMLSIPMQQTALYMTRYESELTAEEISSVNALFGNYEDMIESYDPFISDPVKQYYDTKASNETVSGYLKTWFRMFFKHPGTYFESFFMSTYGWFDPETDTSVRYELDSDYFTRTGLFEGADELLIYFYRYIDRISFFGMLQSPGLWTFIMLILIRRRKENLHLYPMQLITLLVCMAGPCFMKHARYAFPIMFTIPFMMGYEGTVTAGEKNESDIS
ncbi:MAG: DUF6020 family protein [Lachnospiraceae bacterium]|nr:DUF6020 family protein [Lachnospiraceae bacterium]